LRCDVIQTAVGGWGRVKAAPVACLSPWGRLHRHVEDMPTQPLVINYYDESFFGCGLRDIP